MWQILLQTTVTIFILHYKRKQSEDLKWFDCCEEFEHFFAGVNTTSQKSSNQKYVSVVATISFFLFSSSSTTFALCVAWLIHSWEANQILVVLRFSSLRFGNAGAAWRSTHAPTWVMCSPKRPLTHGAKRWQTAWGRQRCGWMSTRSSFTIAIPMLDWWVHTSHKRVFDGCQTEPISLFKKELRHIQMGLIVHFQKSHTCVFFVFCQSFTASTCGGSKWHQCLLVCFAQTTHVQARPLSHCGVKSSPWLSDSQDTWATHTQGDRSAGAFRCVITTFSVSLCASGCHPPVLDRMISVLTCGVPRLNVCVCVRVCGVCDSVVKRRSSRCTDQVALISLRGGNLAEREYCSKQAMLRYFLPWRETLGLCILMF